MERVALSPVPAPAPFYCLDEAYSTTRRVTTRTPEAEGARHSLSFLPAAGKRWGEGGLRRRGYFKETGERKPLITVVTAVFNAASTLERAIGSVLRQGYDNVEFLVMDGGSTDGSRDIIRRYQDAIDYWVSEEDCGIYDAWNKGVRCARGEWIAFLGADDEYLEGALEGYVRLIQERGAALDYVSSRVEFTSGDRLLATVGEAWEWRTFRRYMNVAHVGSLHRRILFERHGLFDAGYRVCGDYEFLLRPGGALAAGFLDRVTVRMRCGGVSVGSRAPFRETARAKVATGGRSPLAALLEQYSAMAKWKVRRMLWRL